MLRTILRIARWFVIVLLVALTAAVSLSLVGVRLGVAGKTDGSVSKRFGIPEHVCSFSTARGLLQVERVSITDAPRQSAWLFRWGAQPAMQAYHIDGPRPGHSFGPRTRSVLPMFLCASFRGSSENGQIEMSGTSVFGCGFASVRLGRPRLNAYDSQPATVRGYYVTLPAWVLWAMTILAIWWQIRLRRRHRLSAVG
jgi:hypothetical protein